MKYNPVGLQFLANELVKRSCEDYRKILRDYFQIRTELEISRGKKEELERFLTGPECEMYTDLDMQVVIDDIYEEECDKYVRKKIYYEKKKEINNKNKKDAKKTPPIMTD